MSAVPPSQIVSQKEKQWSDIRSLLPAAPPMPAHHVAIDELYEILGKIPTLRHRLSLSDLRDIAVGINDKLDARKARS